MADDSDSVDLSDSDDVDYPVPKIGHGTNMDTNLIVNDAFTKLKHWRRKYKKCAKEKDKQNTLINTMQDKLKHLAEVKILYDELKINTDLEVRSLQMKLEHESEQSKRSQVLVKQSKTSLDDMSGKHREAVDSIKESESKLCQTRLELASIVSDKSRIEDELGNTKATLQQTQQCNHQYQITIQNHANKINELQRDLKQSKEQHTELLSQFREAEELCDTLDKRNAGILHELQMLKTTSCTEYTTLSKACSSSKEESLRLVSERDSFNRDLTYTRQTLNETQERLREVEAGYKTEKRTAEEKTICLKQTEMSLEHMQAMFSEKECQYKDTLTRLTADVSFKDNELKLLKEDLREAQSHHISLQTELSLFKQTAESQSEASKREHMAAVANERLSHEREIEKLQAKIKKMRETGFSEMELIKPAQAHLEQAMHEAVIKSEEKAAKDREREAKTRSEHVKVMADLRNELNQTKEERRSSLSQIERLTIQHTNDIETIESLQKEGEATRITLEQQLVKERDNLAVEVRRLDLKFEGELEKKENELVHEISQLQANNSSLNIQISTIRGNLDQAILDRESNKKKCKELSKDLSAEKEERMRIEYLLEAKERQLEEKQGWFREEFEKTERDKETITRSYQEQSDKIQEGLHNAINAVDKAKCQQMAQLVEHHKTELLKLHEERKKILIEMREELKSKDLVWGNKLSALEGARSTQVQALRADLDQRDKMISEMERERKLLQANTINLRQTVKSLHEDLKSKEEIEGLYSSEVDKTKQKDDELNNTFEKMESLEVQLEDKVEYLKEYKEKLHEENVRVEEKRREIEELKEQNNQLLLEKINIEHMVSELSQQYDELKEEHKALNKVIEEQGLREEWFTERLKCSQEKIKKMKAKQEDDEKCREEVESLRRDDFIELTKVKEELDRVTRDRDTLHNHLHKAVNVAKTGKESLQNNQISWGGKEQRYINELQQAQHRELVLQKQLEESLPNEKVESMKCHHDLELSALNTKHDADISTIQFEHKAELSALQAELDNVLLEKRCLDERISNASDLADLHAQQLQSAHDEMDSKCSELAEKVKEFEELKQEHEQLSLELASTKVQYEEDTERGKVQNRKEEQQIRKAMQGMRNEIEGIITSTHDDLNSKCSELAEKVKEFEQLKREHEQLKLEFTSTKITWGGKEQRHMNELQQSQHRESMLQKQLEESLPNEKVESMKCHHNFELSALKTKHDAHLSTIQFEHKAELSALQAELDNVLTEKRCLDEKISNASQLADIHTQQLQSAHDEMNSQCLELAKRVKEFEQLKEEHEQLNLELASTKEDNERMKVHYRREEQQMRQHMEGMRDEVEAVITSAHDEVESKSSEIAERVKEFDQLKQEHEQLNLELTSTKISWGGEEQKYINEIQQAQHRESVLQKQLEESLPNEKVESLKCHHNFELSALKTKHDAHLSTIQFEHKAELSALQAELGNVLSEKRCLDEKISNASHLADLHAQQLQSAHDEMNSQCSELAKRVKEFEQLKEEHEQLKLALASTKEDNERWKVHNHSEEQQMRHAMQGMRHEVEDIIAEYNERRTQYQEETATKHKAELEAVQAGVGSLRQCLSHAINNITITLATINPHHYQQSLRGMNTSNTTTQSDQIATLNTELGHLRATAEHLNTSIKQLEDEKTRAVERCNKMSDEHNALMKTNNELELEMSKQREAFKEEVRGVKNDMKIAENKHEVIQQKLLSAREQIGTLERECRALQSTLSEKSALNSKQDNDMSLIRNENTVLKHSTSEHKENARQAMTEIEGLKARIIVLQEDNKSIRQRSDETMHKLTEKDIAAQTLQNKLNETIQSIHVEHLQGLEEAQQQKEQLQEKIYQAQNELSQVRFEKEAREGQIKALTEQIEIRDCKEVKTDAQAEVSLFMYNNPDDSERCKELIDKCRELEGKIQDLKSDKIMGENAVIQLKHALETEKEKMEAAEQAIKQSTDSYNTINNKQGGVTEELYKARNEIFKVEELLKLEKEKGERTRNEKEEFVKQANIVEGTLADYKDKIYKIKDELKDESTLRQSLQQEVEDKERQLQSEAKLRLRLSAQIGSVADQGTAMLNEKRKLEKLEEKCDVLIEQLERSRRELDTEVASRKLAEGQLSEYSDRIKDLSGSELKIKNMKQKLTNERDVAKKTQEDLIRKVKKCQLALKEEAKERKQVTENYMNLKSDIGEMQGKMTVLLSEAERLKIQRDEAIQHKRRADDELNVLQTTIQRDYCPKIESQMAKKNVEAQTRGEMKRQMQEMNLKIESETKSREAIDKYRTATEARIRDELEKTNRDLKSQVEDCYDTLKRHETQILNVNSENEKLKCILDEERRNSERLYPLTEEEPVILPTARTTTSTNVQKTQDANTAWLAMKSKLNESLNRYMSPLTEQNKSNSFGGLNVSFRERSISPLSPRPGPSPRIMRTSGDSFL